MHIRLCRAEWIALVIWLVSFFQGKLASARIPVYTPPMAHPWVKNQTPRLAAPVAGGHIRQKEKRHETE
jgi:hypothetical protein